MRSVSHATSATLQMSYDGFNMQRSVGDASDTPACLRAGRHDAGLMLVTADNLTHDRLHATWSSFPQIE